jgi:hypothetical protein
MRIAWLSPIVVLTLGAYGCGGAPSSNELGAGGTGGAGGASASTATGSGQGTTSDGVGGTNLTAGSGGSTGTGSPGCIEAATLIYVLSAENDLYGFDPPKKAFKKIGPLGCNTTMQPNSMAVDRDAVAWVNYVESDALGGGDIGGSIFKVSTTDASCQPTSIALDTGWYRLGMGFSSDTVNGDPEQLFVTGTGASQGATSPGLGKIDFKSNSLLPIGQFSGSLSGQSAELTGTGDARLFGFFTTTPVQVAGIDKKTGGILSAQQLPEVETPAAWAFSSWGGDFYLYTAPSSLLDPNRTTNVTKYHPQDGTTDTAYMTNIGFRIVGAGVSTCAPIVPPA